MAAVPAEKLTFTFQEYLALEKSSERRWEFWDGEIVCMSGGSLSHGQIAGRIFRMLGNFFESGRPTCQAFTSEHPVKTPKLPPYRYPDASVVCGEVKIEKFEGIDLILNPTVVIEVVSPTSRARDEGEKRKAYQALSSLRDYVLIEQDFARVIVWSRKGEGRWSKMVFDGLESEFRLPSVDFALPLSELYKRINFPPRLV